MNVKTLINKIAEQLFEAGVDIGVQLAAKDAEVTHGLKDCGCYGTAWKEEEIEFDVFEGNSRDTWQLKARGGAIGHIFNQEVSSVEESN